MIWSLEWRHSNAVIFGTKKLDQTSDLQQEYARNILIYLPLITGLMVSPMK